MSLNKNKYFTYFIFLKVLVVYCQESEDSRALNNKVGEQLDEVVITATRTERQLSSLPLPVTLISEAQIIKTGAIRLDEILEEQTGVVNVTDQSGFSGIQLQGLESEYILILVNGVPLLRGSSSGNFDLSRITTTNIKQVEVVKGASSSLYGSEALGGVINIITKTPTNTKLTGNASYRIARFTEQDINFDISQKLAKVRFNLYANRFSSNGFDLDNEAIGNTVDPFENYTFGGDFFYNFSDKLESRTSLRTFNQFLDSELSFEEAPFESNGEINEWSAHQLLKHEWSKKFNAEYEFYSTNYKTSESVDGPVEVAALFNSNFNRLIVRPEVRTYFTPTAKTTLTSGIGYQHDNLERSGFDSRKTFDSQYIYSQIDTELFNNKLNVILGARFDNHSEYKNQLSPKLALRLKLAKGLSLKTSVGNGFKAPDFRQLFFNFTNSSVGYSVFGRNVALEKTRDLQELGQVADILVPEDSLNDELEAERSVSYNAGFSYKKNALSTSINFFRNDISNLIDTFVIARKTNGQNIFSYRNLDEIYTTGLEFDASYKITPQFKLSGGYQLLFAFDKSVENRFDEGPVFARDDSQNVVQINRSDYFGLVNRSRHNANFKAFYELKKSNTDISFRVIYRSKYALNDTNGNSLIDPYDTSFVRESLISNIAITKKILKKIHIQLGANNVFDYTDPNTPNIPGIQLFTKINYKF